MKTKEEVELADRDAIAMSMGFLTETRFAELAQLQQSTLQQWRKERRGPPHARLGNAVFYSLEAVQQYLLGQQKGLSDRQEDDERTRIRNSIRNAA